MKHVAYMPLNSHLEAVADDAVKAAVGFARPLGVRLHVTTFAVSIPRMASPLGGLVLGVPGMVRVAEERSRADCQRLAHIVQEVGASTTLSESTVVMGAGPDAAAQEARYFHLSLLPWSGESVAAQDMAESVLFGSGRPIVLVPPTARAERVDHLAIAWDGSRVAARAVGDALGLLPECSRITVLTVQDEEPLSEHDIAAALALAPKNRGFAARAVDIVLNGRPIADGLQEEARRAGASLLAMGGFGHSRLRDFILGGATKGVFSHLRLPTLLSH